VARFEGPDHDQPEHTVNAASGTRPARFRRNGTPPDHVSAPAVRAPVPEADLVVVLAWTSVATLMGGGCARGAYPVLDVDGTVVGVLDLADLARHPELHDQLAGQVCMPPTATHPLVNNLVLDNGRLVGVRLPSARGAL
jgi:hypothetical protein